MRTLDLDDRHRVIVLGEGQVGSAVVRSLARTQPRFGRSDGFGRYIPTDWSSPDAAASSIRRGLRQGDEVPRTSVVWSAGTAGMTTDRATCDRNLETMQRSIEAAIAAAPGSSTPTVHIMSSAGVWASARPRWDNSVPHAAQADAEAAIPYVWLKQSEEFWLRDHPSVGAVVHRVASVYARPNDPGRSGMIAALVNNAAQGSVTRIMGRWSTLRNYVHADDVGEFVARSIRWDPTPTVGEPTYHLLADRRSYSIHELVHLVARHLRRSVPVELREPVNAEDHTFAPSSIASGFVARPLSTSIRQMLVDLGR